MSENIPQKVPSYKVISTPVDETSEDGKVTHKMYHVKLGTTRIGRYVGKHSYADVEYVTVASSHIEKEDSHGIFAFQESLIAAADEDGETKDIILYYSPRALTLEELMFSLGEV